MPNGHTFSDNEVTALRRQLRVERIRFEAKAMEVNRLRAILSDAEHHIRTWVSWCDGPAKPHPYDQLQAAKAFLSSLSQREEDE